MTVSEVCKLIKCNIRIEKRDEKGRMMDFDRKNVWEQEVKQIAPYSDGGSRAILIVI